MWLNEKLRFVTGLYTRITFAQKKPPKKDIEGFAPTTDVEEIVLF